MMDFNDRFVVSEIFSTTEYASGWTAEASSGFVPFMIRRKPAACSNVFGPNRGTFCKAPRDRNAPFSSRTATMLEASVWFRPDTRASSATDAVLTSAQPQLAQSSTAAAGER